MFSYTSIALSLALSVKGASAQDGPWNILFDSLTSDFSATSTNELSLLYSVGKGVSTSFFYVSCSYRCTYINLHTSCFPFTAFFQRSCSLREWLHDACIRLGHRSISKSTNNSSNYGEYWVRFTSYQLRHQQVKDWCKYFLQLWHRCTHTLSSSPVNRVRYDHLGRQASYHHCIQS